MTCGKFYNLQGKLSVINDHPKPVMSECVNCQRQFSCFLNWLNENLSVLLNWTGQMVSDANEITPIIQDYDLPAWVFAKSSCLDFSGTGP